METPMGTNHSYQTPSNLDDEKIVDSVGEEEDDENSNGIGMAAPYKAVVSSMNWKINGNGNGNGNGMDSGSEFKMDPMTPSIVSPESGRLSLKSVSPRNGKRKRTRNEVFGI